MDFTALKQRLEAMLQGITQGADISTAYHPDAHWFAVHPFNEVSGIEGICNAWKTLRKSFPDLQRIPMITVAGNNLPDPRVTTPRAPHMVACMGVLQGTFTQDLFAIPATHGVANIRYCEAHYIEGDRIAQSYIMLDFLDLMRQANVWPLAPSLGGEGQWQPPAHTCGVRLEQTDSDQGRAAMERVLQMHAALGDFDGKDLDSMDHAPYWSDDFMWYGPSGIGTTRALKGFRAHHQIPFLRAFPDRKGSGHYIRIGDGPFAVTGGWPSVTATHTGPWLGMAPSGRHIDMRVMDFYHLSGGKITENWVPIDVIHMALQMGVDIFAQLRHRRGDPDLTL